MSGPEPPPDRDRAQLERSGHDRIEIRGLRVLGTHGVLPEEQQRAQPFEVDLDLELDLRRAGRSDRLEATVATTTWAVIHGAELVRVHDVAPAVQAVCLAGWTGVPDTTPTGAVAP